MGDEEGKKEEKRTTFQISQSSFLRNWLETTGSKEKTEFNFHKIHSNKLI